MQIDTTDIGASDHFLVWLQLGRVIKCFKKQKRTMRKWRLDRLADEGVRVKYKEALKAEVETFSERIREKVSEGSAEVGEKVTVCGRAVRWWDDAEDVEERREVYMKILRGQGDLWGEYTELRREVESLVIEKKLAVWNGVVERANEDFEGIRREFWAFVSS